MATHHTLTLSHRHTHKRRTYSQITTILTQTQTSQNSQDSYTHNPLQSSLHSDTQQPPPTDATHSPSQDLLMSLRPVLATCCCASAYLLPRSETDLLRVQSSAIYCYGHWSTAPRPKPPTWVSALCVLNLKLSSFMVYNLNPSLPEFNSILWPDLSRPEYK